MKRKMVLGLVAFGTASMLCGFDSAETADSILQKMQENSSDITSIAMDMTLNCDAAVNIGDGTTTSSLALLLTGDLNVEETLDPLAMKLSGSVYISALGQSETVELQMYEVMNEDGNLETYSWTMNSATGEEGTWEHEVSEELNAASLSEMIESLDASSVSDLAEWGISFELAPEAADVDGTECYMLSSVIDSSTVSTLLAKVSEMTGEDLTADSDVSTILAMLDGIKLNLTYYVDTATYMPVKLHMDLNDSDFSILNDFVASYLGSADSDTTTTTEIVINDLSAEVLLTANSVEAITVPEEALEATAETDAAEPEATEASAVTPVA